MGKKNMVANALSKKNNHEENEREVSNFGVVAKVMSVGYKEVHDFYKNDHFCRILLLAK